MRATVLAKNSFEIQYKYRSDLKIKAKKKQRISIKFEHLSACNFHLEIFDFYDKEIEFQKQLLCTAWKI